MWLAGKPSNFLKGLFLKGLSVNEDYYFLSAVHSFDVETFEFSVPANFVLMTGSV